MGDDGATASAFDIGGEILVPEADPDLAIIDPARYELGRELARGGMGRIVEAIDTHHRRPVAIKLALTTGAAMTRRFVREAMLTARLQHPAIVPVYETGRWPTGEPFFVMKRVDGRSLGAVIAETPAAERLALLAHLLPVTEALAYAHGQGIVHRDIKPSNILVGAYGEVLVIDWGVAIAPDEYAPRDVAGTPAYMAPEQARGEHAVAASDVYSLGAVLYHALAGHAPRRIASGDVVAALPTPLREVAPATPRDLIAIVERAMARDVADRYPTAAAFAEDLRRFVTGELVRAHRYTTGELVRRWIARHRSLVVLGLAALAIAATSFVRIRAERDDANSARGATVEHRESAEQLVGSLLDDLVARLERQGRLDLLFDASGAVDVYYRRVHASNLAGPQVALRHAKALVLRGETAYFRGDLDESRRAFDASIALVGSAPADVAALELSARGRLGVARALQRGKHDSLEAFAAARAEADRLVAIAPDDARAWATWGEVQLWAAYDRPPRELATFRAICTRLRDVAARFPDDSRLGFVVATSELRVAEVGMISDPEATSYLARSIARHEDWTRRVPDETRFWEQLAWAYLIDARRARIAREEHAALARGKQALAIQQRLLEQEPDHIERERGVASCHRVVCLSAQRLHDRPAARAACEASLAITARTHADARKPSFEHEHLASVMGVAIVELDDNRLVEARARLAEAKALLDAPGVKPLYKCRAQLVGARIERADGNKPAALAGFTGALACYEALGDDGPELRETIAEARADLAALD